MRLHAPTIVARVANDLAVPLDQNGDSIRLRMYVLVALCRLVYLFGGSWDIQWHITVGRDSLFIPPHLIAGFGFVMECALVLGIVLLETWRTRAGQPSPQGIRVGIWSAPLPVWGMLIGYASAVVSIIADDMWHRAFGLDAQLWSPPHLALMTATASADAWLLIGLATTAHRLERPFAFRSAWSWAFALAGAYLFDAISFAASEAFLVSIQQAGRGLSTTLYPLIIGIIMPLPLLLMIGLSRRFSVVLPMFAMVALLQFSGLGFAELGFAILRPTSALDDFVRQNAQSTIAMTQTALADNGFSLVGLQQIWMVWLSALPLLLVAALGWSRWARQHMIIAAPVYSAGLLLSCVVCFPFLSTTSRYPLQPAVLLITLVLSVFGGTLFGALGLFWARSVANHHLAETRSQEPEIRISVT